MKGKNTNKHNLKAFDAKLAMVKKLSPLAAAIALTAAVPSHADTFVVNSTNNEFPDTDGLLSLQEALYSANQSSGADTITFASDLFPEGADPIISTPPGGINVSGSSEGGGGEEYSYYYATKSPSGSSYSLVIDGSSVPGLSLALPSMPMPAKNSVAGAPPGGSVISVANTDLELSNIDRFK
jgi:hypothetical protein